MSEVSYGHIAIIPKGTWNASIQYEIGHLVEHNGSSYVAKNRPPVGTVPTDLDHWQISAQGSNIATRDIVGVVKGSEEVYVREDGTLGINTSFEEATELANIIAGEAMKVVLGKISKSIAVIMHLDENALLKGMISDVDEDDAEKIPNSAFIHTLYDRLGMDMELSAGGATNLTQAVNEMYQKLTSL